jgi:hypothetical protein
MSNCKPNLQTQRILYFGFLRKWRFELTRLEEAPICEFNIYVNQIFQQLFGDERGQRAHCYSAVAFAVTRLTSNNAVPLTGPAAVQEPFSCAGTKNADLCCQGSRRDLKICGAGSGGSHGDGAAGATCAAPARKGGAGVRHGR